MRSCTLAYLLVTTAAVAGPHVVSSRGAQPRRFERIALQTPQAQTKLPSVTPSSLCGLAHGVCLLSHAVAGSRALLGVHTQVKRSPGARYGASSRPSTLSGRARLLVHSAQICQAPSGSNTKFIQLSCAYCTTKCMSQVTMAERCGRARRRSSGASRPPRTRWRAATTRAAAAPAYGTAGVRTPPSSSESNTAAGPATWTAGARRLLYSPVGKPVALRSACQACVHVGEL
jgi:hypothetical protein